jgi:hypothetical protein
MAEERKSESVGNGGTIIVTGEGMVGGEVRIGDVLDGAIIRGKSNNVIVTTEIPGIAIGNNIVGSVGPDKIQVIPQRHQEQLHGAPKEVLSSGQALGRIAAAVRLNLTQLQLNMEQARRESSQFFITTMIFAGLSFAIILVGVALMLSNLVTAGIVTTAASIVPEAAALLLFNKDKELRKTIELYHSHILESQRVLTMVDLAETIEESATKDSVKEQIIFSVLKVTPPK